MLVRADLLKARIRLYALRDYTFYACRVCTLKGTVPVPYDAGTIWRGAPLTIGKGCCLALLRVASNFKVLRPLYKLNIAF